LVIPIHGTIDLGLPHYIERSLSEHPEAKSIILEVDTLGGRVDAAIKIRDILLSEQRPVIAYIYRRAISAGALISYAADYIVFSPGSTMGAATPIQMDNGQAKAVGEKMVSYFRSEMRATAEAKGRDGELAESMVDADKEVPEVSIKGKLLTLTNDMAVKFGVANAVIDSPKELFMTLGLKEAQSVRAEESWSETVARAVTDPTLSGLLMSLGMLGIMVELYTPGVGFAGILGFLSLLFFFLGHTNCRLSGFRGVIGDYCRYGFACRRSFCHSRLWDCRSFRPNLFGYGTCHFHGRITRRDLMGLRSLSRSIASFLVCTRSHDSFGRYCC
jgi:membrane-bound serine protease (ClpP class)